MIFTAVFTLVSFMLLLYFGIDIFSAFDVFFNFKYLYTIVYIFLLRRLDGFATPCLSGLTGAHTPFWDTALVP